MKIAVVIPVHGSKKRLELAKRVLLYYETMEVRGLQKIILPVASAEELNVLCQVNEEFAGFCSRDEPIGKKFNFGIWCMEDTVDGVMIVGSDDLISPSVFEQIVKDRPVYQEIKGVHFYDSATGEMVFDPHFLCGSGKYFSKEFLDRCDWRPYDNEAEKNVDKGPNRFLKSGEQVALLSAEYDPLAMSIEVADNMTPWAQKTLNAYPVADKKKAFVAMDGEWEERWML